MFGAVASNDYLRLVASEIVGVPTTIAGTLRETSGPTDLVIGTVTDGEFLKRSGATLISATPGDVTGPASSTDNAVARFDSTTGKLIQNSALIVDDSGNVSGLGTLATGTQTVTGDVNVSGLVDGVDVSAIVFAAPTAQRVFMSPLNRSGAAKILTSGTSYFVYIGCTVKAITPKYVEFHVSTSGSGSQTAEVGLFSTPSAPNKAAQSLTKIEATGTISSVTSTGVKRNTSAFTTSVAAGTHLWAGIRTAMATTQPTIEGLNFDMGQGQVLVAAASGALTGAGPFSGVLLGTASLHGATSDVPDLRVTMD